MFDRRFFAEAAALIAAAVLCALIANGIAARERKLALVGDYPNARVVPQPVAGDRAVEMTPAVISKEPDLSPGDAPVDVEPVAEPTSTQAPSPLAPQYKTAITRPVTAQPLAPPQYPISAFAPHPDKPSVEISPEQAISLWQQKVPVLDARRSDVYRQGHIAGARSFPVWESDIDQRVAAFYEEGYSGEAPIVVYCSGGACEDSHMLAQKLWGLGFNNVLVYTEGWPDWVRRGLPTKTGEHP